MELTAAVLTQVTADLAVWVIFLMNFFMKYSSCKLKSFLLVRSVVCVSEEAHGPAQTAKVPDGHLPSGS
jgi:hypothetical protein